MITFQENTHFSQALPCTREEFWEQVKKPSTRWRVDARRAILAAVEASKTQGTAAIQTWLDNAEFQKFLVKKQGLKRQAAREAWEKKSDAEKLLAFAQEVKDNLPRSSSLAGSLTRRRLPKAGCSDIADWQTVT